MLRPQNGNLGVSFNNTLLNFGLRSMSSRTVQFVAILSKSAIYVDLFIYARNRQGRETKPRIMHNALNQRFFL